MPWSRQLHTLALALPLLAGCGSDFVPFDPNQDSALRVIHGSPDTGPLDFIIGRSAQVAKSLQYPQAAGYSFVTEGTRTLSVRVAGTSTQLLAVDHSFVANTSYTIAVAGLAGSLEAVVLTDADTPAPNGIFRLRVVRLAPFGPAMDFYVTAPNADLSTATPTFAGIVYKDVRGYVNLPTGTGQIRITEAGNPSNVFIDSKTRTFVNGQISTIFIVGKPGKGGGGPPYAGQFLGDGGLPD